MPQFNDEGEEALWWNQRRDQPSAQAEVALACGELKFRRRSGDPSESALYSIAASAKNITIRITENELFGH